MKRALLRETDVVQVPGTEASIDLAALSPTIAAELASQLSDAAGVRDRYGITDDQWDRLKRSPAFRSMLAEALRDWSGQMNAGARIQKKADIVLEDAIPAYDGMIHNDNVPAQARIDAGKLLAQLAGRGQKAVQGDGTVVAGSGFILNINIGGGREKLVIDGKNVPVLNDE